MQLRHSLISVDWASKSIPGLFVIFLAGSAAALDLSHTPFPDELKTVIRNDFESRSAGCQRNYMIAASRKGHWATRCSADLAPADLMRSTLEFCEHGIDVPCGFVTVQGKPVSWQADQQTIRYPKIFDADSVPFVASDGRQVLADIYATEVGQKALAINRDGAYGFAIDARRKEDAERLALGVCEQQTSAKGSCFVYAIGNDVIFTRTTDIFPDE